MYHTADAGYRCGNREGCLRGTRKGVLREVERWLTSELEQRVFWLNGLAGTGKSTIAQTFAETSFADGHLGASFFCSRDFEDRSNLQAILPTLAFQLAYRYPPFRKELLPVLKANPDAGRESLCLQMEKLIIGPLRATHIPTLIIIDALDECKDEQPASAILSILSHSVSRLWWGQPCLFSTPFQLRVFQSSWDITHNRSTALCAPSILSSLSQTGQKTQFVLSTSHFLTSSQTQSGVKTNNFL